MITVSFGRFLTINWALDEEVRSCRQVAGVPGCGSAVGEESKQTGQVDCTGRRMHTTFANLETHHLHVFFRWPVRKGSPTYTRCLTLRAAVSTPAISRPSSRTSHVDVSALRDANHAPSSTGLGARLGLTPEPQFEGSSWTERRHSVDGIQCAAFTLAPAKIWLAEVVTHQGQFVIPPMVDVR